MEWFYSNIKRRRGERVCGFALKEREWGAKDKALPVASDSELMKAKDESKGTILWAWESTTSIFSIASLNSANSIFFLSGKPISFLSLSIGKMSWV